MTESVMAAATGLQPKGGREGQSDVSRSQAAEPHQSHDGAAARSESLASGSAAVRVEVIHADCRDALKELPDCSVDAGVTDPPYALVSIGKRFGAENAAPCKVGATGAYARASRGFMGKTWDTGEVAFDPETWREVWRVLKPGGHLIAFGGTRTYHRLACAIEDAGFEIRDMIAWLYGSGFPKSHDVSKSIDKRGGASIDWFGPWLRAERERRGITQKSLAAHFLSKTGGHTGCVANWELGLNLPTVEQFNRLCEILALPFDRLEEAERQVVGQRVTGLGTGQGVVAVMGDSDNRDITAAASDAARRWQGWGTALKPALEPIVLARKPLIGTVAANVLKHGTGALNIDASRVHCGDVEGPRHRHGGGIKGAGTSYELPDSKNEQPPGRWPANVIHDGSDEVVEAFPESDGAVSNGKKAGTGYEGGWKGMPQVDSYADSGTAARFFYSAKADATDRLESKHPTVKPVDLIAYLVRLITPPGGTVIDPFAGSGTLGMACMREGFNAILIEREAEYVADIKRRIAHVHGNDTPLFAGAA